MCLNQKRKWLKQNLTKPKPWCSFPHCIKRSRSVNGMRKVRITTFSLNSEWNTSVCLFVCCKPKKWGLHTVLLIFSMVALTVCEVCLCYNYYFYIFSPPLLWDKHPLVSQYKRTQRRHALSWIQTCFFLFLFLQ